MHPNTQFTLIFLGLVAVYYVVWLFRTIREAGKSGYIIRHGSVYPAVVTKVTSTGIWSGNKQTVYAKIKTPKGTREVHCFPTMRKCVYNTGSQIQLHYCPEYRDEFIFTKEYLPYKPLFHAVADGAIVWPRFIIHTVATWAIAVIIITVSLHYFGS